MKTVKILGLDDSAATTITGPHDVLSLVGVASNFLQGKEPEPLFNVEIVTPGGRPAKCFNGVEVNAHRAMEDVDGCDLVIVSALLDIEQTLERQGNIISWLRQQYESGAVLASVCTGSFVLAETGLLDHKIATTHWGMAEEFRARYPLVDLKVERLITDSGDILCSGAFNAFIDLSMYVVEKSCGREIAINTAKALVHDMGRSLQSPYSVFNFQHEHGDKLILKIQQRLESEYSRPLSIESLALENGLGKRTLERRFKAATGDSPLLYLQRVRVEAAKHRLEQGGQTFSEISYAVGYDDPGFFRKLFKKFTGLRPSEYREKFTRSPEVPFEELQGT
ncbi:MAG: helix-turn-helix domain-containing protein [Thermodesulfobacteriota bacterium]